VHTSLKLTVVLATLLLIITDGRIRMMQMDKKTVCYHAVLAPQARKQSVRLVSFRNRSDYTYY